MITIANVTFDCDDPPALAAFWAAVTDSEVLPDANGDYAMVAPAAPGAPQLLFLKVPEPKTAKNRCHLDLATDDLDATVAKLIALGATRVHDRDLYGIRWTTLQDPEGNELCIAVESTGS